MAEVRRLYLNSPDYPYIITVGPLIMWGGRPAPIINQLNRRRYNCRNADPTNPQDANKPSVFPTDNVNNCATIMPGEFKHINYRNPRSVLALGTNGAGEIRYCFIYIEGRAKRGQGMTIKEIQERVLTTIPDFTCISAINLDGGHSSSLSWLSSELETISIINPRKKWGYPIGSIISYASIREDRMVPGDQVPLPRP